ncbi:ATP-binding protein [Pseudaquabacterium pictum]|uniref:Bacterial transcriptional activator domain-containing protein n=1 Tax=Pseudaquabacterium pictum TaxID=2315236 RepID=A0A480ATZ0_9BURK|nr:BTAD domain-containing putative transcriptional regulator [Rubrivivax pictus]GCL63657.1 hypothetical protein AQPW35_27380 [Rubrivivax pictus]
MSTADPSGAPQVVPSLRLLGPPALLLPDRTVPLRPDRAHGLLALLACRRDWLHRDVLADQLYPDRDLDSARSNLRKVIHLARKVDGVGAIDQRGELLRWSPDSDLLRFEAACDAGRHDEAVAAYGGPLLQGLDAAWPAASRDWLDAERLRLQSRWQEACACRLAELADQPAALLRLAEALLRLDPLDELALQALARAQQALGRGDAARAAVTAYADRLSATLQLEPSAAVRQLADDLHRSAMPAPVPAPGVVGRRQEQALVRQRLATPGCRVLTLLGPPGVGKSALARALLASLAGTWVPLEDLTGTEAVPARIAGACGRPLDATLPPWVALARALGSPARLLVLDNCEHLPLAAPLATLLADVPNLQVLATARAPLGVAGEWRLPLDGLPLPDLDETDPEVLRANDAVQLFELRTLAARADFQLGAEAAAVVHLLHEVAGLPLAIELLAAWRRLMPVQAMREELAASLDLLDASAPGERGVRAAFERSWRMLGPAEQRVLAQLAALPGPCQRALARQVLPAPLPVLAALVDRSLLQVDDAGQFSLHPLLRRLAAPLVTDASALQARHARHVAAVLGRDSQALAAALPHAQAAWQWALDQGDLPVLDQLATAYPDALLQRAQWREALAALQAALALVGPGVVPEAVPAAPTTGQRTAAHLLAQLEAGQARCHLAGSALDAAAAANQRLEALATAWGFEPLRMQACGTAGNLQWLRGDNVGARAAFAQMLTLARAGGDGREVWRALGRVALAEKVLGHYEAALAASAEALAGVRATGQLHGHLYLLNNSGNLLRLLGRHDEALAMLHEGLTVARQTQRLEDEPYLLVNLALVHESAGRLDAATRWAAQAVASAQRLGPPMIEAAAWLARARGTARLHRQRGALADVHAALAIAHAIGTLPLLVQCLSTAGVVLAALGDTGTGVAMVRWAIAQPVSVRSEREDAQRHLAGLGLAAATGEPLAVDTPGWRLAADLPRD